MFLLVTSWPRGLTADLEGQFAPKKLKRHAATIGESLGGKGFQ